MLNASVATDVTIDSEVIGRVGEYSRRLLGLQQGGVSGRVEGASTIQAVIAEQP
jgi:hypothetical protein